MNRSTAATQTHDWHEPCMKIPAHEEALKAMDARLDGFRTAARVGRDGKNCKKMYNKCGVGYHEVTRVLDMA